MKRLCYDRINVQALTYRPNLAESNSTLYIYILLNNYEKLCDYRGHNIIVFKRFQPFKRTSVNKKDFTK